MRKFFLFLLLLLVVLAGIVLFNTYRVVPFPISVATDAELPVSDSAVMHMSEAVQIPTVSYSDSAAVDSSAYRRFDQFLSTSYPLVHSQLKKKKIDSLSFVFEWTGTDSSRKPIILMGHCDVVPVEEAALSKWKVPPFSGIVTDSCVWGRGAVDDKSGVIAIMEAAEACLRKGFRPRRTIFLCFGHNEEVSGSGARGIVKYLSDRRIRAEMVLDEGGEITRSKLKDVARPVAVIGVGEKGYASYELLVEKEGGHSSMPASETAISILVAGLDKLKGQAPPNRITPPVKEFLGRVGASSNSFVNRMASTNMWLFTPVVMRILSATPEGNAMIHTTIAPTIVDAGIKDNVIPGTARAIVNSRILPGETSQTVFAFLKKTINDDRVQIKKLGSFDTDPSPETPVSSTAYRMVESAAVKTVPGVLVTPYLMIGATDSRYYRPIADGVVNFLPVVDSKGFHGINERLPIADLHRAIRFMETIITESDK